LRFFFSVPVPFISFHSTEQFSSAQGPPLFFFIGVFHPCSVFYIPGPPVSRKVFHSVTSSRLNLPLHPHRRFVTLVFSWCAFVASGWHIYTVQSHSSTFRRFFQITVKIASAICILGHVSYPVFLVHFFLLSFTINPFSLPWSPLSARLSPATIGALLLQDLDRVFLVFKLACWRFFFYMPKQCFFSLSLAFQSFHVFPPFHLILKPSTDPCGLIFFTNLPVSSFFSLSRSGQQPPIPPQ